MDARLNRRGPPAPLGGSWVLKLLARRLHALEAAATKCKPEQSSRHNPTKQQRRQPRACETGSFVIGTSRCGHGATP